MGLNSWLLTSQAAFNEDFALCATFTLEWLCQMQTCEGTIWKRCAEAYGERLNANYFSFLFLRICLSLCLCQTPKKESVMLHLIQIAASHFSHPSSHTHTHTHALLWQLQSQASPVSHQPCPCLWSEQFRLWSALVQGWRKSREWNLSGKNQRLVQNVLNHRLHKQLRVCCGSLWDKCDWLVGEL